MNVGLGCYSEQTEEVGTEAELMLSKPAIVWKYFFFKRFVHIFNVYLGRSIGAILKCMYLNYVYLNKVWMSAVGKTDAIQ